jgi:hypothetical protein
MRHVTMEAAKSVSRDREELRLFGPQADLSAVDTSAPVQCAPLAARRQTPRWGQGAWGVEDWGGLHDQAGFGVAPWGEQPWAQEPRTVSLATARRYEYGVIPIGVKAADAFGNVSDLDETTVLVVSHPQRPVSVALSEDGSDRLVAAIQEWPDG